MDIEEFKKGTPPAKKRSQLMPFRKEILSLKSDGYTNWQIRDWLAENNVTVSHQAVQQFLSKQMEATAEGSPEVQQPASGPSSGAKKKSTPKRAPSGGFDFDLSKKSGDTETW